MAIKVTITECYGEYKKTILTARTDDVNTAVERAIAKGYGAGKYFCRDYGLSIGPDALSGCQ